MWQNVLGAVLTKISPHTFRSLDYMEPKNLVYLVNLFLVSLKVRGVLVFQKRSFQLNFCLFDGLMITSECDVNSAQ